VFEGKYGQPRLGAILFSDFVKDTYLPWARVNKRTWRNDEDIAAVLISAFKGKALREINPLDIERFKLDRRKSITERGTARSASSVNSELSILSGIFRLAVNCEQAGSNPRSRVKLFKVDNQTFRYLTWDEETALLLVLDNPTLKAADQIHKAILKVWSEERARLRDAILIAIGTGLRRSEQLRLKPLHCDFASGVIQVTLSKTYRNRKVPMSTDVRAILRRLCVGKDRAAYLFANPQTGKPYKDFKTGFSRACADAGIEGLSWKDLRATFATRLGEAGYNAFEIAALLGHSDIKTTQRYVRVEPRIHEAVNATMSSNRRLKLA